MEIDALLNNWISTNKIQLEDIPFIAKEYCRLVNNDDVPDAIIQKLMASGVFQIIDWDKALTEISQKLNKQIMIIRDTTGTIIKRYFEE